MGRLFGRRLDLVLGNVRIQRQHASFKAEKSLAKHPNTLDLKVLNLSRKTRGLLQGNRQKVILLAGLGDNLGQVFAGDSRTVDHAQDGAEVVTRVQCGDGESALASARLNESFGPGAKVADVMLALIDKLGVNKGNGVSRLGQGGFRNGFEQLAHGFTASGRAAQELDRLMDSAGLTWSVQDGAVQVLGPFELAKGTGVLLTPKTGLIGSPTYANLESGGDPNAPPKPGKSSTPLLKARCLLQPLLKPGGRVEIQSEHVRGVFRIEKLTHQGDVAGDDWYTDLELRSASAPATVEEEGNEG